MEICTYFGAKVPTEAHKVSFVCRNVSTIRVCHGVCCVGEEEWGVIGRRWVWASRKSRLGWWISHVIYDSRMNESISRA